nr:retrovirus-related Pol polyprotein from transposon TNT 1-94 [Tanacetum cinerariifolium]
MLLAMKDEVGSNLSNEEEDFMLDNAYGIVHFGNDHFAVIIGYGDYVQGNLTICHVYYIESLGQNLFSVGQLCDGDLEVAFHSNMSYVRNLEGDDLLIGYKDLNLYTISISNMAASSLNCSIVHTWHKKTPYELIHDTKPNIQYFHVFGYLCYPTNDRDDLAKMKPKANIGIFIGYSKSSRGFCIYNCRTKKIMETIHVKFDELTAMASECKNLEPRMNCMNFNDSSEDSQLLISKSDLHNLFGPMYEDYYATSSQVSNNSAANTLDNDHTSSSSSIVVEQDDAPQIVSSSEDQVANEP